MFERIVQHGILTTVVVLIVCVLGVVAAFRIPVQMIPDLEVRTITIRTDWPGATPQDIEKEILIEQEEFLRNLPNLKRLTSNASFGRAEIEMEFPFGVDINEVLIRVNNSLSQVPSYPNNVDEPRIYASSFSANSFMYLRISPLPGNPRGLDMDLMQDFIEDNVRTHMESIPGVSQVSVGGGADRQVQILMDPGALARHNLAVSDVREAILQRNQDVSGGEIESGKRRYLLRTIGRFEDVRSLNDLILARRGDAVIRLGDVARVQLDHFEMDDISYANGKPVISLSVRREAGSNVINIKNAVLSQIDDINEDILRPAGMELALTSHDVRYVEASVATVWKNLGIGAVLATLVMFLFLRSTRATLVGIIGIPVCTIAAFLGLLLAGRTINVISLAGVAFAIGMTLDNSIVVLESIQLARQRGLDRFKAAIDGVQKVWPAVLASTLTTVLVFVPIVFIDEEAGQLYSDIAIAISASILASMIVAIAVIPTASARLTFHSSVTDPSANGIRKRTLEGINSLTSTQWRRMGCMALTAVISAGIFIGLTPPAEYLPEGEEPKIFARMNAPPGYNLQTMSEIGDELHEYFLPFLEHSPEQFEKGETEVPAMRYCNLSVEAQSLRIIAEPKDPDHTVALMDALSRKYEEYPGMRAFVSQGSIITTNDAGTRSVNLDISGPRLEGVYDAALAAYRRTREVFDNPRIQADPATLSLSQPLVEVRPDWDRAEELGFDTRDIGFAVAALTDGAFVDEFFLDDDKIDIYLYSDTGTTASLDSLSDMPLYTPGGDVIPLTSIATVNESVDTSNIRRVNGRRTVTLSIVPPRDVALETGVDMVRSDVVDYLRDRAAIASDVSVDISGASDQLEATQEALLSNYVVALAIIYLLLVAIFSHWGYPLLIMTAIPMGVAGGILGLWLLNLVGSWLSIVGLNAVHQPFDMISMLGFLILMGTVVNNPILIVHRAMTNSRNEGMSATAAVRDAVDARLRPIAMSTITTVAGLSPLVFLPGEGTELYRGVGAIVLFGIVGTAFVTLTFLPSLTITVLNWQQHKGARDATTESEHTDSAMISSRAGPPS